MEALILAGGLGTRLREVVSNVPKPLAPVGGTAFLDRLVTWLLGSGVIDTIVLSLGYKAEQVIEHFAKSTLPLHFVVESYPLGTGGAICHAADAIKGESFLVCNGDSMCALDVAHFANTYEKGILMACAKVAQVERFGQVEFDPISHEIQHFKEKGGSGTGWINGGVYALNKKELASWPKKRPLSLEKEVLVHKLQGCLKAYPCEGRFFDIGTKESYKEVQTWF